MDLLPRPAVEDELAVLADDFAVDGDGAAAAFGAEIADHVPVESGGVFVAGFWIA